MLLAKSVSESGAQFLIIGLSRGNIRNLIDKHPILATQDTHGSVIPEGLAFCIVFGETEQDIYKELEKRGLVSEDTRKEYRGSEQGEVAADPRTSKDGPASWPGFRADPNEGGHTTDPGR